MPSRSARWALVRPPEPGHRLARSAPPDAQARDDGTSITATTAMAASQRITARITLARRNTVGTLISAVPPVSFRLTTSPAAGPAPATAR